MAHDQERASRRGETGLRSDTDAAHGTVVPLDPQRRFVTSPGSADEIDREARAFSAGAVWRGARYLSAGLLAAWLIAWPVGTTIAYRLSTGTFSFRLGYSPEILFFAVTSAALILGAGFALASGFRFEAAAQRFTRSMANGSLDLPQSAAARQQVVALNAEIDLALERLAKAESLIRQQVKAIDSAGAAIEAKAVKSTDRLEQERRALMDLTEEMNREAERFAEKIAERSAQSAEAEGDRAKRTEEKEKELATQLQRLEAVSAKSLDRFEHLAAAMEERSEDFKSRSTEATEHQTAIASQLAENKRRIEDAQAELRAQSERLESLIRDQRKRADKLAKIVTDQASRLTGKAPAPAAEATPGADEGAGDRKRLAWKDILASVDEGDEPEERPTLRPEADLLADAPPPPSSARRHSPQDTERRIARVHNFSLVMRNQLFEEPSHEELDRFERGEKQLFARDLVAREPHDLRVRIASEVDQNAAFRQRVQEFLRDFDTLLEPLSTKDDADAAIEAYLASPIGRLYVLTGTAVNHFV